MKIRTIMAAAATGILLTAAGSSLAWGADWTCPRGYADCTDYEYCRSHEHGDCGGTGQRTGIGYARTGTMDGHPHRTPQGMDAIAETAIMADAGCGFTSQIGKTVLHLAVPDIWSGYAAGIRCRADHWAIRGYGKTYLLCLYEK